MPLKRLAHVLYGPHFAPQTGNDNTNNTNILDRSSQCDITHGFDDYCTISLPVSSAIWADKVLNQDCA